MAYCVITAGTLDGTSKPNITKTEVDRKPGFVRNLVARDDHLSRPHIAVRLKQPTRKLNATDSRFFLLGLAPDGVYLAG